MRSSLYRFLECKMLAFVTKLSLSYLHFQVWVLEYASYFDQSLGTSRV